MRNMFRLKKMRFKIGSARNKRYSTNCLNLLALPANLILVEAISIPMNINARTEVILVNILSKCNY